MKFSAEEAKKLSLNRHNLFYLLISIFLLVNILRGNDVLFHGRFFAEEGSYFWANALGSNFLDQLTFVAPETGYLLLISNIVTELSTLVPVIYSPLFTTWISFFIMTTPAVIAFRFKPNWISKKLEFAILVTLLISAPIMISEIFANTINSQIFLALGLFIFILYFPSPSRVWKFTLTLIFLFSFLSGWYSIFLLPAYAIRILGNTKNSFHLRIFLMGVVCGCVQISVYVFSAKSSLLMDNRGKFTVNLEQLPRSILGLVKFVFFYNGISFFVFFIFLCLLLLRIVRTTNRFIRPISWSNSYVNPLIVCCLAFASELTLITFGSTGGYGGRYIAIPGTIGVVGVFLFVAYLEELNLLFSYLSHSLFVSLVISGFISALQYGGGLLSCEDSCVSWQVQVRQVEMKDRDYWVHWPFSESPDGWRSKVANPIVQIPEYKKP